MDRKVGFFKAFVLFDNLFRDCKIDYNNIPKYYDGLYPINISDIVSIYNVNENDIDIVISYFNWWIEKLIVCRSKKIYVLSITKIIVTLRKNSIVNLL